jgi:hypothetical protein
LLNHDQIVTCYLPVYKQAAGELTLTHVVLLFDRQRMFMGQ